MKKGTVAAVLTTGVLVAAAGGIALFLTVRLHAEMKASSERLLLAVAAAEAALQEVYDSGRETTGDIDGTAYSSGGTGAENSGTASAGNAGTTDAVTSDAAAAANAGTTAAANSSTADTQNNTDMELWLSDITDTPVIWVGDSRTLGMQKAVKDITEDIFIGAAGEGYDWLYETGLAQLEAAIEAYSDRAVIFNSGVNDYDNLDNYLRLYAEITAEYPDTVFYFLSVNPVDEERCQYITNAEIEDFNAHLRESYPDTWLDSYSWLIETNSETIDGIHYSEDDYRRIYVFVKELLAQEVIIS